MQPNIMTPLPKPMQIKMEELITAAAAQFNWSGVINKLRTGNKAFKLGADFGIQALYTHLMETAPEFDVEDLYDKWRDEGYTGFALFMKAVNEQHSQSCAREAALKSEIDNLKDIAEGNKKQWINAREEITQLHKEINWHADYCRFKREKDSLKELLGRCVMLLEEMPGTILLIKEIKSALEGKRE